MDINQLLFHHQVALMNAADRQKKGQFDTGFDMVEYYAKRIRDYRTTRGLSVNFATGRFIPAADIALDDLFAPAVAISMQTALVADLMIAEMLIEKAAEKKTTQAGVLPPYLGDLISSLMKLQADTKIVSTMLMERLEEKIDHQNKDLDGYPNIEICEWENEGGSVVDRKLTYSPLLTPISKFLAKIESDPDDHDARARRIRQLLKVRTRPTGSNDD